MITRGIRELMGRDWQSVRERKDAYWGERIAPVGPLEGFRIAEELRRQALAQTANWPSETAREADLANHVRVAEMLRRARAA